MASLPKDMYQPETSNREAQRAILIVTTDGVEDLEFFYPYYRFIEAGFRVDVATPAGSKFEGKNKLGLQETLKLTDIKPEIYEMLYVPGGKAPAALKENADAIKLTQQFVASGKPVGSVCHGPQLLAKANVITGRKIAAFPEVEAEVKDAGATFVSQECVTDGQFTTARWPGDLPAQMKAIIQILGSKSSQADNKKAA